MTTEFFDFTKQIPQAQSQHIGKILRAGGIVAIPTETVYGLAANAFDVQAVSKVFAAKGRPQDNPLIVHIAEFSEWKQLVKEIPQRAMDLAKAFWPGPLTIILPKTDAVPSQVCAGLSTVAVRMPENPVAAAIIKAAGVPLAAPSANLSGKPSPTRAEHVVHDLDGKIDAIVDGGECAVGLESTVVSLTTPVPRLLRPGGITPKQLVEVLGELEIDDAVLHQLQKGQVASSPGMKYLHYSPDADVMMVKGSLQSFIGYIKQNAEEDDFALCFDGEQEQIPIRSLSYGAENDSQAQAHRIFDCLRELDKMKVKRVFARCPDIQDVGLAVFNRLIRAAGFQLIEV